MKAEELMIDDWVQNRDCSIKGKVINIDAYKNRVEFSAHTIDANFVCPILLTSEILEKNGFDYNENREAFEQIPNDGFGICKDEDDNCFYFCLGIFDAFNRHSDITYHYITKVKYVHELQHALRLCGIEKEIVL